MSTVPMQTNPGFDNDLLGGFFGNIGRVVSRTFEEQFPVWTSQQLGLQRTDQLGVKGTTFVPVGVNVPASRPTTPQAAGMLFDNVSISGPVVLGVIGLGVALVAVTLSR